MIEASQSSLPLPSSSPSSPNKSKRIRKQLEHKIAAVFREERREQLAQDIYLESEDAPSDCGEPFKRENYEALLPTLKVESADVESSSYYQEEEPEVSPSSRFPRSKPNQSKEPLLQAEVYKSVKEIDFEVYMTFLARTKIYGGLLMDELGRLVWCDKATHELLEGSLNNFYRTRITDLLLNSELDSFLHQLKSIRHYDERTTLKWVVYSKNAKRRYKDIPLPKRPTARDIFYRFLKSVTVRIRPVSICLPTYKDPNGFCHSELMPRKQSSNCFFLELRLTKTAPDLHEMNILNDPVIKKYIRSTGLKLSKRVSLIEGSGEAKRDEPESVKAQSRVNMEDDCDPPKRKQLRKGVSPGEVSLAGLQKKGREVKTTKQVEI